MFDLTHEFQSLSSQGSKIHSFETPHCRAQSVAYRGGVQTPLRRNSEGPPKSCQTQTDCENLKIAEFKTPTPQDVRNKRQ